MDIKINLDNLKDLENNDIKMDVVTFQKMYFLYNSLEHGWTVKKNKNSYVFTKPHDGKKEVLEESYLLKFMKLNLNLKNIFA
jgi:hypothetical protein